MALFVASCNKDDDTQIENFETMESLRILEITAIESATANVKVEFSTTLDFIKTGICWSEGMNPRVEENLTEYSNSNASQQTFTLYGTSPGKQYYVRAFTETPNGLLYSENATFTTPNLCAAGAISQDFTVNTQAEVNNLGAMGVCSVRNLNILSDNPNDPIIDLTPLSGIIQVTNLSIGSNNSLTSLQGLETIENVSSLSIFGNDSLQTLEGLEGISGILHGLYILSNNELVSLRGLENVALITLNSDFGGEIRIENNNNLETLEGLEGVKEILMPLHITFNPNLQSLKGLDNVRKFDGIEIFITDNDSLENLQGFENLQIIKGNFHLINLPELNSLEALSSVTRADFFYFRFLDSLTNLDGLENISPLFSDQIEFYIWDNEMLTDISAFSSYTSIGALSIIDSPVTDLSPLSNISTISFNLSFRDLNISSLSGLSSLASVGRIFFSDLNNISSLEGLENLRNTGMFGNSPQNGNVEIYGCKNLSNFCALEGLVTLGSLVGDFSTSDNAYNPSLGDLINGNCSQ